MDAILLGGGTKTGSRKDLRRKRRVIVGDVFHFCRMLKGKQGTRLLEIKKKFNLAEVTVCKKIFSFSHWRDDPVGVTTINKSGDIKMPPPPSPNCVGFCERKKKKRKS